MSTCILNPSKRPDPVSNLLAKNLHIDTIAVPALLVVLASASVFVPQVAGWLLATCLGAALLTASWIDARTRLIPNRLTYPLFLVGIGGNLIVPFLNSNPHSGVVGIEASLTGAGICFGLMLLLFVANATGGGDVKLATAIGAFLGPQAGLMAIAWCHVLAGVCVLVWVLSQLDWVQIFRTASRYLLACCITGRVQPIKYKLTPVGQKRIPMAAFFTLGVVVTQFGYRLW